MHVAVRECISPCERARLQVRRAVWDVDAAPVKRSGRGHVHVVGVLRLLGGSEGPQTGTEAAEAAAAKKRASFGGGVAVTTLSKMHTGKVTVRVTDVLRDARSI